MIVVLHMRNVEAQKEADLPHPCLQSKQMTELGFESKTV